MADLGKRLGVFLIGNLILYGLLTGASNLAEGKNIFGRNRKPKDRTYVDWKGNIHLATEDFVVV